MNYERIYFTIIENRLKNPVNGYVERHHILPRSLGGSDEEENLVSLTAKEHFICHLLLVKIYETDIKAYRKMLKAFMMMRYCFSGDQKRYLTAKTYDKIRKEFGHDMSVSQSGEKNSQFRKTWITNFELQICKKHSMDEPLPEGWVKRRIVNFDKYNASLAKLTVTRDNKKDLRSVNYDLLKDAKKLENLFKKEQMLASLKVHLTIYKEVGFEKFVEITGYKFSQQNLVTRFAKHLPEFKPQNGKKRSKVG